MKTYSWLIVTCILALVVGASVGRGIQGETQHYLIALGGFAVLLFSTGALLKSNVDIN